MPKREDINKVMVIGNGPIVIGQAAEFDYSGTQACKALREEGVEVVLVNSNPATIMTDVDTADRVYIEPMDLPHLEKIISLERPDGILPTLGGQTGLNLATELFASGISERYGMKFLGTSPTAIARAEDRELFKVTMSSIGMPLPPSVTANTFEEAMRFAESHGFPVIVRPGYTLGGTGGGIAYNRDEFRDIVTRGFVHSLNHQVLIEESVVGWKEIEYEVMRDAADNCITVCDMENIDAMGIHTGDSMVVAPSLTLSDREYQLLRSASLSIIRALKIEGGCNVQFALHPGEMKFYVIEVNPRVSRSSALASKATGYPIARVAAKIALGLRLDEIVNQVTGQTMSSFEPTLDYVVLKIPKWPFEKFSEADRTLGTQMKSTGEVMSIDRTFTGAFLKALDSLEVKLWSFHTYRFLKVNDAELLSFLSTPTDGRIFALFEALHRGHSVEYLSNLTNISPYFIRKFGELVEAETRLKESGLAGIGTEEMRWYKTNGFSDKLLAKMCNVGEAEVTARRTSLGIMPVFKAVDTCASEFAAETPYFYSTHGRRDDPRPKEGRGREKVLVVGSGPIRIGQGIEFDYCSVHALMALSKLGYDAIIINNNPETVSTDFDMSDGLYFEPITLEKVLAVVEREQPKGVVVQFGGQTAINIANDLARAGVHILGTTEEGIDTTEDREKFDHLMAELRIPRPAGGTVVDYSKAVEVASRIGFPVLVRPSYVLGGRAMEIIFTTETLGRYIQANEYAFQGQPLLIDKYYRGTELEVDLISDGDDVIIPGIMEHIERSGIHSGDSMAVYPPVSLSRELKARVLDYSERIARSISAQGIINIQFVVDEHGELFVIEVNPRASRTIPFLSKVTGIPMVTLAIMAITGHKFRELGLPTGLMPETPFFAVKSPVFSFAKMIQVDVGLGPEMKSTGEVMGIADTFPQALKKSMLAAGLKVPQPWKELTPLLCTVADKDKEEALYLMQRFAELGFPIYATTGTAAYFERRGLKSTPVFKLTEGRPHIIDRLRNDDFQLIINTISDNRTAEIEARAIRRAAVESNIPVLTSLDTANALLAALVTPLEDEDGLPHVTELHSIPRHFAEILQTVTASSRAG
ncbi:MAG: carbamoyl phosphate synthase large subunit [Candidatus Riflebacteria bacterium RBG_13_59_9]|nr:MAG: carbamoyl phosphate synthase large subunit [Candidatus Riflebacteria bacterium RBG_13_59_9]